MFHATYPNSFLLQVSQLEVPVLPANPIGVPLYDMDRRSWELEPDMGCMTSSSTAHEHYTLDITFAFKVKARLPDPGAC